MLVGEAGGRSLVGALAAALIALACVLALPAVATAETFLVNSIGDEPDATPVGGLCQTVALKCTLRAAIQQANSSLGEFDAIGFEEEGLFDGQSTGTIAIGTALPTIVDPIAIEGECVVADVLRPCVGVDGPGPSEPALIVENAEAVIDGLAITGAKTGIEVTGSPRLRVLNNWLGVRLDGSAGGNGTGVLLGEGSENVRIGNEGESNVFANNTGDGLDIHGVSNVRVMSGYFGVGPDGTTLAPNEGKDIEVAALPGSEARGTLIGTQLSSQATATPVCDGGCNVISGSEASGIDLEGDGGEEEPATATTIVGNYIGLDASGTAAVPIGPDRVHVGQAAGTSIGGPRASEANRLAGGGTAVSAGPAANLVVRGNSIGVGADGGSLAAPDEGIVVNSEGLPSAAAEAVIAGNEIRMSGGVAISQQGRGGWLVGNEISGAETGISASGETEGHGNLIQGNAVEGSTINGILIESGFNEILGNDVVGSGGAGIQIEGAPFFFGVSGNLIGGNVEADENFIADSGGAAIEISNPELATNEVARNWGFANSGLFIDLVAAAPATEPKGPNEGIRPPTFFTVTGSEARGGDAEPDGRVRLFRKADSEAGELESFLGEAIVDEEGEWKVAYGTPVPDGTIVAATQTSPVGGTSELAVATVPAEPAGESNACVLPSGCGPASPALPIPRTKIFTGPKGKKFAKATVAFKFKASLDGSSFQCKLDGAPFRKCHSPKVYTGLKPGKHVFKVRAINSAGKADPTPAKLKFQILPR